MRAGRRLQGDGVHAGDFDELVAEHLDDAQRALRNLFRLVRMRLGQTAQARDRFIHTRVVLHGARAERIHAVVHRVVPCGQAGEVADDFDLAYFGHLPQVFARSLAEQFAGIDLRNIEWRQFECLLAW